MPLSPVSPFAAENELILAAWSVWLCLAAVCIIAIFAAASRRARIDTAAARHALIVAAHPDDCVIVAGEYALDALHAGCQVRVVYLTCGSDNPSTAEAATREQEALAAWALAGLPPTRVEFVNLPQSAVHGPSVWSDTDREQATQHLLTTIRSLPENAVVFVPAAGEMHRDHRELRALTLAAADRSQRPDVQVFEAPEYNDYHAISHQALRGLAFIAQTLPAVGRTISPDGLAMRAGFICGPAGHMRPPVAERLELKRRMLRTFASQDGEALVRWFGHPDLYRPIPNIAAAASNPEVRALYFRLGGKRVSPLVALACVLLWAGIFLAGLTSVWLIVSRLGSLAAYFAAAACVLGILVGLQRVGPLERKLSFAAFACGVLSGLFA